ncbi:hypothetical protein SLEP1_g44272 [Rubroshorea leprosula]|uniref:Uncharacterized protein n=1 Tax=Rubroshorea leprosula TaxID=152421 RepID=A0AAV5LG30_9ROSI|nr:hypothetical protein SLEP1_g44272 [Rubroshorea leprosula]
MVRTFTGGRPPRNEMDEQEDIHVSEPDLNDFRPMPRNLFVGGAERDHLSETDDERTPTGSTEPTWTTELEERTRVLEMAMGKILARLIPDDPLIPLLNRDAQPAAVVATQNFPALSNIVVPTRPRGSRKLNIEPSSSKHSEELMRKNTDLERQLWDVQKSIDELKSPRSNQQTLDLDSAPLNLSITAESYQEGFKIPHLETYDGSGDPDEHLHTYQAIMKIQNANDAMMCKVFPATLKSTARRWTFSRPSDELMISRAKARNNNREEKRRRSRRRPPPPLHDSSRADKSKHCDYHRVYGHNTEDCQHLKDELEFLARNGKLEGAYRGRPFNRRGQGSRTTAPNQKDRKGVGYAGIPPPSGTINMISGGVHSGGQSARGRKAYARQVMTINKNRPLKRPFEEAEWENAPITFSPVDYKRAEGKPDVMMPHGDPFVATVHIGNHNVNKVFVDTGSSLDILYWSCFQKMQLNPNSLQKHEGPIYGFDNQPVSVEGIITLPIYVGSEPRFRMASVTFLVVKMESAFNTILGRATLCELKAVISQPHLCMKFPTPQGVGVLKGNQKMARTCYQDTFKKVELAAAPIGSEKPVESVETVPLNPDVPERMVKIGTKLIEEERAELLEFLRDNQDVFAWTTDEMPGIPAELTVHKLSTDPTKRPAGFIRRMEYSEWVSNPVLVKKPNGKWRMCIDFTNLNEACPKDPHPLPNVEKLVERAAGHERMSFLDVSSGYHQNAGATYQKLVQIIFKLQISKNIEVYVDDMIVTNVRAEDHIGDLSETFQNLRRAQMKLNPLKCTFAVESGKLLGYVVSKKGIEVNPEKVEAIQQMEQPRTIKDVQRLTGRVAALHRFIARSAERCLPFFKALREPKNFQWTDMCQRAFYELKQYLALAPLLSKPVEGESLYLYLGVTTEAISSVLLREENKNQNPICYVSKVLQGAEQNYPLAEKAAFALVYTACQAVADFLVECISTTKEEKAPEQPIWVLYVDGAANVEGAGAGAVLVGSDGFKSEHALRFKFQTTNNAAEYEALIYGLKLASELKAQSIQVFSDSKLVVGQVKGSYETRDPQLARYASVLASAQETNPHRSTTVEVLDAPSYTDFTLECQLLSTDPCSLSWTAPLINYLQSGELPEDQSATKLIKRRAAHFTLIDNQLYKWAASMPLLHCLTPYEAEYAVREVHEGVCGTHIGGKTLAWKLLRHGYYWPTMVEDAQNYVKKCPTCQFNADDIHMPVVAVDYFTKWIEAKPLSTTTKKKIEEFLFNSKLCRFGIPKRIIADNGPQFRAAALRSFCNNYGIELALTSVYTPQSNRQAESANKIVLRSLKTRVLAAHLNWVDELNKVPCSCRTTPSSATGETPFSLAYGAEAVIPVEVGLPSNRVGRHDDLNNEQLLRENLDFMEEVREMSRIRNMAHQSHVAKFYNTLVRARQFQVGDLVLRKAGLTNTYSYMGKLAPNWEGPYMVVRVKRPGSYVLADVHRRQLPYL